MQELLPELDFGLILAGVILLFGIALFMPYCLTLALGIPDEVFAKFEDDNLVSTWGRWFALFPVAVSNDSGPWHIRYVWLCFFEWRIVRVEDHERGPFYLERRHVGSQVFSRRYRECIEDVMLK